MFPLETFEQPDQLTSSVNSPLDELGQHSCSKILIQNFFTANIQISRKFETRLWNKKVQKRQITQEKTNE